MRLLVAFACAATIACGSSGGGGTNANDAASVDGDESGVVPIDTTPTCDVEHDVAGPACVPRFDTCGSIEVPRLGGGCLAAGVPKDACGTGFVSDGAGGCSAVLPTTDCARGTMAVPGETTCRDVAPCGAAPFGDEPTSGTNVYVDASYTGAASDGSKTKPYVRIADAIAAASAGSNVVIAAGSYKENVVVDRSLKLFGRCPSMVEIAGQRSDAPAIDVRAENVELHRLAVTSVQRGIRVWNVLGAVLDKLWVHDTTSRGIGVYGDTAAVAATLRESLVEHAQRALSLSDGSLDVENTVVRDTTPDGSGNDGEGVVASSITGARPTTLTVRSSLFERAHNFGIFIWGVTGLVERTVVRETLPLGDGTFGVGIGGVEQNKQAADLTVHGGSMEKNTSIGVLIRGAKATLENVTVRDSLPRPSDGKYGRGIVAQRDPKTKTNVSFVLRASRIVANTDVGVDVDDATSKIERVIVEDTKSSSKNNMIGTGIALQRLDPTFVSHATVSDSIVRHNAWGGLGSYAALTLRGSLFVANGGYGIALASETSTIEAVVVRDGVAGPTGVLDGMGIEVGWPDSTNVDVTLTDSLLENNMTAGIAQRGMKLGIARTIVRGTRPHVPTGTSGMGIAAYPSDLTGAASLSVSSSLVEHNHVASILVYGVDGNIDSTLVRDTAPHPNGSFGDGIVALAISSTSGEVLPATLTVQSTTVSQSTRAGISVFGSTASIGRTTVSCASFDLDVERNLAVADAGPPQVHDYNVADLGENACGCADKGPSWQKCAALSSGLAPIDGPSSSTGAKAK